MSLAGSPGVKIGGDGVTGDVAGHFQHLQNAKTLPLAQIVLAAGAAVLQGPQGQDMRLGQIQHVDVVAPAGAIGGGVIVAKNGKLSAFTLGYPPKSGG